MTQVKVKAEILFNISRTMSREEKAQIIIQAEMALNSAGHIHLESGEQVYVRVHIKEEI